MRTPCTTPRHTRLVRGNRRRRHVVIRPCLPRPSSAEPVAGAWSNCACPSDSRPAERPRPLHSVVLELCRSMRLHDTVQHMPHHCSRTSHPPLRARCDLSRTRPNPPATTSDPAWKTPRPRHAHSRTLTDPVAALTRRTYNPLFRVRREAFPSYAVRAVFVAQAAAPGLSPRPLL